MNQQCKVCGEPAAGFHFGAFTCEGCKSFFGRTYNNMSSISECKNNGDCIINKKNRTSCKSCRLRKCLLVGMSKSGSRYGRRSNWFKIHCLLQEQGSSMSTPNCLHANMMGPNGSLYSNLFNTTQLLSPDNFFDARLNSFSSFPSDCSKDFLKNLKKYRTLSDDSGSSSTGDIDTESPSGLPHSSHQTPRFSDKNFEQKKPSPSPNGTNAIPLTFTSPQNRCLYTSPRFRPEHPTSVSVAGPALTPTSNSMIFLDTTGPSWSVTSGGDLLLCSPAVGGIATEQDQPIDLSVKSYPKETSSKRCPRTPPLSLENEIQIRGSVRAPLDLTSKRHKELVTHSS